MPELRDAYLMNEANIYVAQNLSPCSFTCKTYTERSPQEHLVDNGEVRVLHASFDAEAMSCLILLLLPSRISWNNGPSWLNHSQHSRALTVGVNHYDVR